MDKPNSMQKSNRPSSVLEFYSLGQVAENKLRTSNLIRVIPIEKLSLLNGELKSETVVEESEGRSASGEQYVAKGSTNNAIVADWVPWSDGSRMNAPDVRRGERVMILRNADSPEYYWVTLGLDNHLRKKETAVYMWSATEDETDEELTADNSYCLTISSHEQAITLSTSKTSGEYCTWAAQFNLKDGRFIVTDDLGNEVEIDAKNTLISLINAEQSKVVLDKANIFIKCKDSLFVDAGKTIDMKTKTFNVACTDYTLKCTNYTLNASEVKVTSSSNTFTSPSTKFTGNLEVGGSISATGSAKLGGIEIEGGKIKCSGIDSTGDINAPNID